MPAGLSGLGVVLAFLWASAASKECLLHFLRECDSRIGGSGGGGGAGAGSGGGAGAGAMASFIHRTLYYLSY